MKSSAIVIEEIKPGSVAVISGAISTVIGAFIGIVAYVTFLLLQMPSKGMPDSGQGSPASDVSAPFPYLMLIILPVLYGVLGFFIGYVSALVYNMVARYTGGITMLIK